MRGTREKPNWLTRGITFRRKAEGTPCATSGLSCTGGLWKWFCMFLLGLAWCGSVSAAPFDKDMTYTQGDGTEITIHGRGDEFYATFTYNGYSVVCDHENRMYYYARCSADGTVLESTGARAGIDPVPAGIEPNEAGKLSPEVIRARIDARRAEWEEKMGIRKGWEKIKADFHETQRKLESGKPMLMAAKYPETTGEKVGLTILVDFPDDPQNPNITSAKIDQLLNGDNCTLYGNVSSVRSYYRDVSNGKLDYSNVVIPYIRVRMDKREYNKLPSQSAAWDMFFRDVINALSDRMESDPSFRQQALEAFDQLTLVDTNVVQCFNVWYAGSADVDWAQGLWPASGPIDDMNLTLPYTDLKLGRVQMSDMGDAPSIYVFCHENGHMLCKYPDFYDYGYDSKGGAGDFCLMSSRPQGSDQNPQLVCAVLRYLSGWTTPIKISKFQSRTFEVKSSAEGWDAQNTIYIYENKTTLDEDGHASEYYLIENRQKYGRDATLPASGIAIWHMDEKGNTDDQRYAYNKSHHNYEATLIQADGKWDFENNRNDGDANDLWYEGNSAQGYLNAFTSMTDYNPSAANRGVSSRWWSGLPSGLNIIRFSASGSVMTFETQGLSPTISNRSMKNGRVGSLYSNVFTAVNAEGAQTWSITEGDLPEGLELEEDGVLAGVPEEAGEFEITVHVETTEGQKVEASYTFTILPIYELPYEESFTNDAPDSTWGWFEESKPLFATDPDDELDDLDLDDGESDDPDVDDGEEIDPDEEPDEEEQDEEDSPEYPYYSGLSWSIQNGNGGTVGYPDSAKSAPFCLSFVTNRIPQITYSSNVYETVEAETGGGGAPDEDEPDDEPDDGEETGGATIVTNVVEFTVTKYPRKLISTPRLDLTGLRRAVVSFDLINRKRSGRQDELRVYYRTSYEDEWILLESYTNSVPFWTRQEIVLPDEAESDTAYIGFEGILYGGYGIHIDDVVISDPTTELTLGDVALEEAIVGVPYEVQIPVSGGVQPYTWELDGDLPDGLSFTNGVIFGTPTTEETCTFTVTVSDEDEVETVSQTYTLVVDLPHVTLWQETFDHASGEMPTGWTQECVEESLRWISYSGSPSHVPNAAVEGMYNASLYWHDYVSGERTNHITRLITPLVDFGENPSKLALNFWLCMRGRYNLPATPFDQDELRVYFKANADDAWGDPIAVYTNSVDWWTFQKVPLPADNTSGYFCFEGNAKAGYGVCIDDVRVVDATDCPIVITKSPLPSAYATAPYSVTLQATGGEGEYAWEADEDDLPPGLTLSDDGVLSGTPTKTGTYYFDVTVTDEAENSSSRTLSVTFMGGIKPSKFVGTFDEGMDWESWSVANEKARGWVFTNGSAPREIQAPIPSAAYEGNTNALLFFNGSTRYVSRLTTPMIDFSGATNVTLSFWLCKAAYSGFSDELYVDYRTNYEGEATTILSITTNVSEWTQYTVELPDPSATTFITFRGKTKGGCGIALDDVTFDVQSDQPELTVYQQWKQDWLEDADYDDDGDYDEDGLSTKEEFVFGADPTAEDYEAALLDIWIEDGIAYVSFREGKAALEYGVVFELQSCSDLALRDWTSEGLVLVDTDDTEDDYYEVIYTYGDGDISVTPQRFFRLQITWPDDIP